MLKPVPPDRPKSKLRLRWPKRRPLRSIAMLPTLLTLGNLYFGFSALYCCVLQLQSLGEGKTVPEISTFISVFLGPKSPSYLSVAAWMLVVAMVCDALDGLAARRTGQSSKFGEQLDSLADVLSFGAAPAMMVITLTRRELAQWQYHPWGFDQFGQAAMLVGVIYLCCTALRLARFNVEATLVEAQHKGFSGLPSPGGAAAVASLILLHEHLDATGWQGAAAMLTRLLPFCTLAAALLMVSRVPYTHAISTFLRRRRPFSHVIPVLLVIPFMLLYTEVLAVVAAWLFVLSGIVTWVYQKTRGRSIEPQATPARPVNPVTPHPDSEKRAL